MSTLSRRGKSRLADLLEELKPAGVIVLRAGDSDKIVGREIDFIIFDELAEVTHPGQPFNHPTNP